MHELGVVVRVVEQVEEIMRTQGLVEVETLVLQIGELSSMVPHYGEACFPAAVEGTLLAATHLVVEVTPAEARCRDCGARFRPPPPMASARPAPVATPSSSWERSFLSRNWWPDRRR